MLSIYRAFPLPIAIPPSETDVSTTRRPFHALHTVGIHLGEHFIVAGGKYMPTMCNSTSYNGFERLPFAEDEE